MHAAQAGDSLTRSVEDYLKTIYRLTPEGRPAATSEIAQALELTEPAASMRYLRAVRKLREILGEPKEQA